MAKERKTLKMRTHSSRSGDLVQAQARENNVSFAKPNIIIK